MTRATSILTVLCLTGALATPAASAGGCPGKTFKGNNKANTIKGTCGPDKIYGMGGNDKLIGGDGADKIFGGDGNDSLDGGGGKDTLKGEAGKDSLRGAGGGDQLIGGGDSDTASYAGSPKGVTVGLGPDTAPPKGGHAAGDELKTIENLRGSAKGDDLAGDFGSPNLIVGLKGPDNLGGGFEDVIDYRSSPGPVNIVLDDNSPELGWHAQGDTIWGGEILGSRFNDQMQAGAAGGTFAGGGGSDTLIGGDTSDELRGDASSGGYLSGEAGSDVLLGGGGLDVYEGGPGGDTIDDASGMNRLLFWRSPSGVTVDLDSAAPAIASGGDAEGDQIEGTFFVIYGSQHDDTLTGTQNSEIFAPLQGNDTIDGSTNPPISIGMDANLGDGLYFLSAAVQDQGISVDLAAGTADGEGSDQVNGIEHVAGTPGPDLFSGNAAQNVFLDTWNDVYDASPDTFDSFAGSDIMTGGPFDDFDGGEGDETHHWPGFANPGDVCWGEENSYYTNCENTHADATGFSAPAMARDARFTPHLLLAPRRVGR